MQSAGVWKILRADVISVTLKFGFYQNRFEYSINDASNSVIERLYRDAERWIRELANNCKNGQLTGRYIIYLFRIPATEFTMVPIVQLSDIEQNSFIEVVPVHVGMDQNSHSLFKCQLTSPTNCSKCSRFIAGLYKQGFRCRKCQMIYHRNCAPFLLDDCPVQTSGDLPPPRKSSTANFSQVKFINPFVADPTSSTDRTMKPQTTIVPFYTTSTSTTRTSAEVIEPNTIIDKGIFPACLRGAHFYGRYLFRLTTNTLSMTTNLSSNNVSQKKQLPQSGDIETTFLLTDIDKLVLTHIQDDKDDIFEIHLRNKTIISVGKRTDSHDLQMATAQFYSLIRDQRETLINTMLSPSSSAQPSNVTPVTETMTAAAAAADRTPRQENPRPLAPTKSIHQQPPCEKDNEDKDLHELYAFTGEKIGEGAFGRVMGAYRKSTHQQVAIKIMEKANCSERDIQRINEEIGHLCRFNHVNILKLEAYYERDDAVYLVTERMETDMCSYITRSKNGYLDEDTCKMITYQVIIALRYLHGNNCSHLDVKCDNILITLLKPTPTDDKKSPPTLENHNCEFPLVKLADFGYSRIIGEHSFRKTRVGTKVYNAPEIYNSKEGYNRLADMWSVGIVLYAALSGTLPYDEKDSQRAEEIVRDKRNFFANSRWAQVSKDVIDLISNKLLVVQLNSRIKSTDALFHNWFTDYLLYKNLREIEKRTKYFMLTRQQELPSSSTWLTGEREDLVWTEYQALYAQSK